MPNVPPNPVIHLEEITARNETARRIIGGFSATVPTLTDIWQIVDTALTDTLTLAAEITRLRAELTGTRLGLANLVAAVRATLAAHRDHEPDPLWYLRDELGARGQLPHDVGGRS